MNTVKKQSTALHKGDRVVLRSSTSGKPSVYVLVTIGPYDREDLMYDKGRSQGPWLEAQLAYDVAEPDGHGGTKLVSKAAPIIFRERELVEVMR